MSIESHAASRHFTNSPESSVEDSSSRKPRNSRVARAIAAVTAVGLLGLGLGACKGGAPTPNSDASPSPSSTFPTALPPSIFKYAGGRQDVLATGASVRLSQERPKVSSAYGHSLMELALTDPQRKRSVEVGWTVDPALNGDSQPHLFVYHAVNGYPAGGQSPSACYNKCGFVSLPGAVKPGARVEPGIIAEFGAKYANKEWQIFYNNKEIGYFPESLWKDQFEVAQVAEAFGEVGLAESLPCAQMGDGEFASSPSSARIGFFTLYGALQQPSLVPFETDPALYTYAGATPRGMHIGGPGTCK